MQRIRQSLTLTRLTAVETLRQPICLLLAVACVLLTAATPLVVMHKFGEEGKLARDSGLAFHFVFGLFIAGTAAGSSLSRELRKGTASAILSKPVPRDVLFLSKYAGIGCVLLLFSAMAAAATLLCERVEERFVSTPGLTGYVTDWQTGSLLLAAPFAALLLAGLLNYLRRGVFSSTAFVLLAACVATVFAVSGCFDRAGRFAPFDLRVTWRILPAGMLVTMALLVLAALAVALSTRLRSGPTLVGCGILFMAGLVSDYLFGQHAATSPAAAFLHAVLPNWQHFWVTDALSGGGRIPVPYILRAAGYGALYTGGVLAFGMLSFRGVEVKG